MKKSMKIFCDFDGTIALEDVGHLLFQTFAEDGWEEAVEKWRQGLISGKECLTLECALTKVSRQQLEDYCDAHQIDPTFFDFVDYCKKNDHAIIILSDGLDFYIDRILRRYGLDFLPFYANKLVFGEDGSIFPEFPYYELGCKLCGNCKGYHVRTHRSPGEKAVYVGDGYSDRCGVQEADVVFAKGDLLEYCRENAIGATEFNDFGDVLQKLKAIK